MMEDAGKTMAGSAGLSNELNRYKQEYAEFIETAAHDLDAPLRKLSVLVEKVTAECESGRQENARAYVPRINRCLSDMRSLVDDLALLSRVGLGAGDFTEFDLETVVREALQEIDLPAEDKKTGITISSLPVIKGDRVQYRQLFKNLLQNAVTFGKKDISPVITIQSEAITNEEWQRGGGDYCKISITDNGIGFKQEYAEKIFRPFVRLHGKSAYGGNGIGLALCRKIIENHQGIIYADGNENTGARFVLIIPQIRN